MDARLQALLDKQEITEVVLKVARATDRGDLELFRSCFHDDGEDYHGITNGSVDAIIRNLAKTRLKAMQHLIGNTLIDLRGEEAQAESCFDSFQQGPDADGRDVTEFIRGRYLDLLARRDGVWKIRRRVVLWDWSHVQPVGETWFERVAKRPGVDTRFVYGRRDRHDMVYTDRLPPEFDL